jgi:hypothetical protein
MRCWLLRTVLLLTTIPAVARVTQLRGQTWNSPAASNRVAAKEAVDVLVIDRVERSISD